MGYPSHLRRVLFARATVLELCFFVSVRERARREGQSGVKLGSAPVGVNYVTEAPLRYLVCSPPVVLASRRSGRASTAPVLDERPSAPVCVSRRDCDLPVMNYEKDFVRTPFKPKTPPSNLPREIQRFGLKNHFQAWSCSDLG